MNQMMMNSVRHAQQLECKMVESHRELLVEQTTTEFDPTTMLNDGKIVESLVELYRELLVEQTTTEFDPKTRLNQCKMVELYRELLVQQNTSECVPQNHAIP
eukprot:693131_1